MKEQPFALQRLMAVAIVALVASATIALALTDLAAAPVGAIFLVLVIAGRLSHIYRFADVGAAIVGSAAYAALEQQLGRDGAVAWGAATVSLIATVVIARLVDAGVGATESRLRVTERVVEDLTLYDEASGLLKRRYGELAIEEEVRRARRTGTALTLILLCADPAEDHPLEALQDDEQDAVLLGALIRETLRTTDRSSRLTATVFAALLPHTNAAGGVIVAEKLREGGAARGGRPIRCGVATFPDHAVSAPTLLAEAETALRLARTTGIPVVNPVMLRSLESMS